MYLSNLKRIITVFFSCEDHAHIPMYQNQNKQRNKQKIQNFIRPSSGNPAIRYVSNLQYM